MFGIPHTELIIILVVIFVLFGHRLPSVMRDLGCGVVEFKYRDRRRDQSSYWLATIDLLMIVMVVAAFAALAAILMPR